jgi:hypothetical protein
LEILEIAPVHREDVVELVEVGGIDLTDRQTQPRPLIET